LPKVEHGLFNVWLHEPRQRRSWLIFDVSQMKATIALLCVWPLFCGCAKTRDATKGISNVCPVHKIPMDKRQATIVDHGDIRSDLVRDALQGQRAGLTDVHATLFPFAESRAHTHRESPAPDIVLIYVCRECVVARERWRTKKTANKTPEPTTTSVTLRAIVCSSEMKYWTEIHFAARSVPAVVVAHL